MVPATNVSVYHKFLLANKRWHFQWICAGLFISFFARVLSDGPVQVAVTPGMWVRVRVVVATTNTMFRVDFPFQVCGNTATGASGRDQVTYVVAGGRGIGSMMKTGEGSAWNIGQSRGRWIE